MRREELRQNLVMLRDEIKLHVHLGTMEAKDRWKKLEPKLFEAEKYLDEVQHFSETAVHDVMTRAQQLRDQLKHLKTGHDTVGRKN